MVLDTETDPWSDAGVSTAGSGSGGRGSSLGVTTTTAPDAEATVGILRDQVADWLRDSPLTLRDFEFLMSVVNVIGWIGAAVLALGGGF